MQRIELSGEVSPGLNWHEKLRCERKRTDVSPKALLRLRNDVPPGLKYRAICDWLSGASKTARENHLLFVLDAWAALPTVARLELDAACRAELRALKESSGISVYALLAGRRDRPAGLTPDVITSWLNGSTVKARKDHYDYTVALWRGSERRISITPTLREELQTLKSRSGIGSIALLKARDDVPRRLNANVIDRWLSGDVVTAREGHVAYVRELWRAAANAQAS